MTGSERCKCLAFPEPSLGICVQVPVPRPLIRHLTRRADLTMLTESAALGCDLPENDWRANYLRATVSEGPEGSVATPFQSRTTQ